MYNCIIFQCSYLIRQQSQGYDLNTTTKMPHVYIAYHHTIIITSEVLSLTIGVIKVSGKRK